MPDDRTSDWNENHPQTVNNEPTSPPPGKTVYDEDRQRNAPSPVPDDDEEES